MVNTFNFVSFLALAVMSSAYDGHINEPVAPKEYVKPAPPAYVKPAPPAYVNTGIVDYPDTTTSCTTDLPGYTPAPPPGYVPAPPEYETTTYTSVYTSCEAVPTIYTLEGEECTTTTQKTHYLTTTVCDTTELPPAPTTIYHTYETTLESCVEIPTVCSSEGVSYTTKTSTTAYITSTVCETNVYTPHHPGYTHPPKPTTTPYAVPPASSGYPVPPPVANKTTYAPPELYQATGAASINAPGVAGIAAVFGLLAAFF